MLDEVLTASAAGLSGESAGDTAVLLARAEARISALRLRLLEQAAREDTCTGQQAVSEGWWADRRLGRAPPLAPRLPPRPRPDR